MSVHKITGIKSDFSIVPNRTAKDKNLSWEARGMLLYLYSQPEDWEVSVADLMNQTKGSRKHSGRDACNNILKELEQAGYIHKTQQDRAKGKFTEIDRKVCILPYTGFPCTDDPLTDDPEQQSTERKKNRTNKVNITDIIKNDEVYNISQLCPEDYEQCHLITEAMQELKDEGYRLCICKLRLEEWDTCETLLREVYFEDEDYQEFLLKWLETYGRGFRKEPSLPDIVVEDVNGTSWAKWFDVVMCR